MNDSKKQRLVHSLKKRFKIIPLSKFTSPHRPASQESKENEKENTGIKEAKKKGQLNKSEKLELDQFHGKRLKIWEQQKTGCKYI